MPQLVISGSYLALHRPQKGTYYIMKISADRRQWDNASGQSEFRGVTTTIHTSTFPNMVGVSSSINVKDMHNQLKRINMTSSGQYLKVVNPTLNRTFRIPVFKKTAGQLAWITVSADLAAVASSEPDPEAAVLFTMRDDPPPAPAPPIPNVNINFNINNNRIRPAPAGPKPIPRRIAWLIADDACKNNGECPITMESLTPITAKVTSCFHVFDGAAIDTWLQTHNTCPVCKQACSTTAAWVDEDVTMQQAT